MELSDADRGVGFSDTHTLDNQAEIIAIGNDESYTNGVLVRPDSPIAKVKGWNKAVRCSYGWAKED